MTRSGLKRTMTTCMLLTTCWTRWCFQVIITTWYPGRNTSRNWKASDWALCGFHWYLPFILENAVRPLRALQPCSAIKVIIWLHEDDGSCLLVTMLPKSEVVIGEDGCCVCRKKLESPRKPKKHEMLTWPAEQLARTSRECPLDRGHEHGPLLCRIMEERWVGRS